MDPFAGIALPEKDHNLPENSSPWSLTWASGEKRAILSFPMMDLSHLPEQLVDLNDMEFLIHVAPSGQVLSADATAPGSGDVRVDRYAAALALEIIFEARPDDFGVQQGRLRVFFQEDAP
ncbi:MAG: hypothetical protein MI717_08265 [Spirochaetales bacterium]|nr:hypothetical protein [Spirochaetales bacterium]